MKSIPTANGSPRIAVFTHDAYGLGHIRRCSHIVQKFSESAPNSSILLVTGSPAVQMLKSFPPNADYVKIPTVVTSGVQGSKPPMLSIGLAELSLLRRRMIQETITTFAPDVFLVDNFPLGSRLELLPTLMELRKSSTRILLGLRDVADPPQQLRNDWSRDGIYEVLERYYDRILVYGVPQVLDVVDAYGFSDHLASKVHYCGYVTAESFCLQPAEEVREDLGFDGSFAVATVGGGGDGFPLLKIFLNAMRLLPEISAFVILGEFMSDADKSELRMQAEGLKRIVIRDYVSNLPSYIAAADVTIAMGGYNTTSEILALDAPAILVPRIWRSGEHRNPKKYSGRQDAEQLVRTQALAQIGLVESIHPDQLNPENLAARIANFLHNPRKTRGSLLKLNGLEEVCDQILSQAEIQHERREVRG
ncbi:hypothetical protein L0222_17540 [bacterium]|nr:hypothetical protein [bacterium]